MLMGFSRALESTGDDSMMPLQKLKAAVERSLSGLTITARAISPGLTVGSGTVQAACTHFGARRFDVLPPRRPALTVTILGAQAATMASRSQWNAPRTSSSSSVVGSLPSLARAIPTISGDGVTVPM